MNHRTPAGPPDQLPRVKGSGEVSVRYVAEKSWRARRCNGAEFDPRYVDVVVARWEAFTRRKRERVTAVTCDS